MDALRSLARWARKEARVLRNVGRTHKDPEFGAHLESKADALDDVADEALRRAKRLEKGAK
jgi:hypothetical protein